MVVNQADMGTEVTAGDAQAALRVPFSAQIPHSRFCFISHPDDNSWSVHRPLQPSERQAPVPAQSLKSNGEPNRLGAASLRGCRCEGDDRPHPAVCLDDVVHVDGDSDRTEPR